MVQKMKKLTLLLALSTTLLASLASTAQAAPLLVYNYTFSFVLNTAGTTMGNDNNPTVTGELTLTQLSASSTSFVPTSLTFNALTLPIDMKPADDVAFPGFTITGSQLTASDFTLSTPSTGVITTQGNAYTSAGDSLKDSSNNSYLFGVAKASGSSDLQWTKGGTGGTYFAVAGVTYTLQAAPEPSSWVLAFLAVGGFFFLRRRVYRA
jgi:MYXO-CTERM domain-containing protein